MQDHIDTPLTRGRGTRLLVGGSPSVPDRTTLLVGKTLTGRLLTSGSRHPSVARNRAVGVPGVSPLRCLWLGVVPGVLARGGSGGFGSE